MRNCIAVLTRGYKDMKSYDILIKRNKHISNNLNDKTIDNLIFHEGNICASFRYFCGSLFLAPVRPETKK
jgi:hypothetical protein